MSACVSSFMSVCVNACMNGNLDEDQFEWSFSIKQWSDEHNFEWPFTEALSLLKPFCSKAIRETKKQKNERMYVSMCVTVCMM